MPRLDAGVTARAVVHARLAPIVAAAGTITVGWVGDSRAYWLGRDGDARRLTEDDSWADGAGRRRAC